MGYYIDLNAISLDAYKEILKNTILIPSWKVLETDMEKNLNILKKNNINNLHELLQALKNNKKILDFSKQSGLAVSYLTVLRRAVNGYKQKPNKLKDFVCIDPDIMSKLESAGIKNTLQLYQEILSPSKRSAFGKKIGISAKELLVLTKLTDLSRIRWVNHTFAYILLETGYDTAQKVANADFNALYESILQLNNERKIYKASIGLNDMKMIVESANSLDLEIEYE